MKQKTRKSFDLKYWFKWFSWDKDIGYTKKMSPRIHLYSEAQHYITI